MDGLSALPWMARRCQGTLPCQCETADLGDGIALSKRFVTIRKQGQNPPVEPLRLFNIVEPLKDTTMLPFRVEAVLHELCKFIGMKAVP